MSPNEKQRLIEKIDGLSPGQRKRVEGYVDALHEMTQPNSAPEEFTYGSEKEGKASEPVSSEESIDTDEETLDLSLRGALSHLKDEYTAEELLDLEVPMNEYNLDFDDAYQYVAATSREMDLVSFDTDFDRTDIERLEPTDVLDEFE